MEGEAVLSEKDQMTSITTKQLEGPERWQWAGQTSTALRTESVRDVEDSMECGVEMADDTPKRTVNP